MIKQWLLIFLAIDQTQKPHKNLKKIMFLYEKKHSLNYYYKIMTGLEKVKVKKADYRNRWVWLVGEQFNQIGSKCKSSDVEDK